LIFEFGPAPPTDASTGLHTLAKLSRKSSYFS
jgi:hypothetical protein